MQNPLGPYGNLVAAVLAILLVGATIVSHAIYGRADPWLDNSALLALGVVFGTQVVQNGTQAKAVSALLKADAANRRLDAVGAPAVAEVVDRRES